MIESIIRHLGALVSFDTANPPRRIPVAHPLFAYLQRFAQAHQIEVTIQDHGDGRVAWLGRRGTGRVLFHVHLDTVPASGNWTGDPLTLRVEDQRVLGLGACDIKGAAACLLALMEATPLDIAVLLTTDEEGSERCCVQEFCRTCDRDSFDLVVVAEPTECQVVYGHRGYLSVRGRFRGRSGHTSAPAAERLSATHQLIHWAGLALARVAALEQLRGQDLCFNIGTIAGGTKNNMVSESAEIGWSSRPPAGFDVAVLFKELTSLPTGAEVPVDWLTSFQGPSFPFSTELGRTAEKWLAPLQLATGPDVDFWTEASIFSQVRWPAVVLGPGSIRQAHAVDEYVDLDQLRIATEVYSQIAKAGSRS